MEFRLETTKDTKSFILVGFPLPRLIVSPIIFWGDASAVNFGVPTLVSWNGILAPPDFSLILKLDPGKQITLTKAQKGMLKLLENSPLSRVEWKDLTIKQKVCGKTTWFSSIPVLEKNGFVEESNGYYRLST